MSAAGKMAVRVRESRGKHHQGKPPFTCMGCRDGEHHKCLDDLRPKSLRNGIRLCSCDHHPGEGVHGSAQARSVVA